MVTSLLRGRLGLRSWRAVHWLAYAVVAGGARALARHGHATRASAGCSCSPPSAPAPSRSPCSGAVAAGGAAWTAGRARRRGRRRRRPARALPLVSRRTRLARLGRALRHAVGAARRRRRDGRRAAARRRSPAPLRGTIVQSRPDVVRRGRRSRSTPTATRRPGARLDARRADRRRRRPRDDSRVSFGTAAVPNLYVGTLIVARRGRGIDAVLRSGSRLDARPRARARHRPGARHRLRLAARDGRSSSSALGAGESG